MGRGRGFSGTDFGGFTGNFRGGRPMYHPMEDIDFEIQQWGELAIVLIARVRVLCIHNDACPRRIATKRAEHSRRSGSRITPTI